jgi:hypothetical protein
MIAGEAMDTDAVISEADTAIVTRNERDHALVAEQALLQHGGVGPHAYRPGQGDVPSASLEVVPLGLDRGEVDQPRHPLAGDASGLSVRDPFFCHALPFA